MSIMDSINPKFLTDELPGLKYKPGEGNFVRGCLPAPEFLPSNDTLNNSRKNR